MPSPFYSDSEASVPENRRSEKSESEESWDATEAGGGYGRQVQSSSSSCPEVASSPPEPSSPLETGYSPEPDSPPETSSSLNSVSPLEPPAAVGLEEESIGTEEETPLPLPSLPILKRPTNSFIQSLR